MSEDGFEHLLEHLKAARGFDFTGYKRTSLERRILKRMEEVGVEDYAAYVDYLEVHQDEFSALFNTILINVTGFFRDAPAWDFLATDIVPRLLAGRPDGEPLRVWSAGCATGEETYTAAMILAEAVGADAFGSRVKIYATDVDEEALETARHGVYPAKAVEAVPEPLRERYFDRLDGRYGFRKDLRRSIIFGRNDLVQDAPISRVDLLLCRNTLMYFSAETQSRILRRFHFALQPEGYLFLGKSEMLITHSDLFTGVNVRRRVFTKVPGSGSRTRVAPLLPRGEQDGREELRETAFDAAPLPQVIIAPDGALLAANQRARVLLGVTTADIGRAIGDLDASYKPVELRAPLRDALTDGRPVLLEEVPATGSNGEQRLLDVELRPLEGADGPAGVVVSYVDRTAAVQARDELERSRRELGTAYEELQSTIEELETTNEELQSTNEELETMNEELQSTNEELETMNDELRQRTLDLDEAHAFTETVLISMGLAVMVVDTGQCVRLWNRPAEELWGLRADEVENTHVLNLDIGLPVEDLRGPIRTVLEGGEVEPLEFDATDRRARRFRCRVAVMPMRVGRSALSGAIVLMERIRA